MIISFDITSNPMNIREIHKINDDLDRSLETNDKNQKRVLIAFVFFNVLLLSACTLRLDLGLGIIALAMTSMFVFFINNSASESTDRSDNSMYLALSFITIFLLCLGWIGAEVFHATIAHRDADNNYMIQLFISITVFGVMSTILGFIRRSYLCKIHDTKKSKRLMEECDKHHYKSIAKLKSDPDIKGFIQKIKEHEDRLWLLRGEVMAMERHASDLKRKEKKESKIREQEIENRKSYHEVFFGDDLNSNSVNITKSSS